MAVLHEVSGRLLGVMGISWGWPWQHALWAVARCAGNSLCHVSMRISGMWAWSTRLSS